MKFHTNLVKQLDNYLNLKKIRGAFFIDGKWGVGKTTFINEYKNYLINKGYSNCPYVSLHGKRTISSVYNEIYSAIHPILTKLGKSPIIKILRGAVETGIANKFNIDFRNYEDIKIEDFQKDNIDVIIFDDLERCSIDIEELFGYLNSLMDEYKCKIILLGNEEELLKKPEFHLEYYKLVKEKTISETYTFEFMADTLFESILSEYKEIKNIVLRNRIDLCRLIDGKCNNLRTCIFSLDNFEFLYNKKTIEMTEEEIDNLFIYVFLICINFKHPNAFLSKFEENNDIDFGTKKYKFYDGKTIYPYPSVKKYIEKRYWNETEFNKDIGSVKNIVQKDLITKTPESLVKMKKISWLRCEDEQLTELINNIYSDFNKGFIQPNHLYLVYHYIYYYQEIYFFDKICDLKVLYKQIKKQISDCTNKDLVIFDDWFFDYNEYKGKTKEIIEACKRKFDELNELEISVNLLDEISENQFMSDMSNYKNLAVTYRCFLSRINIDEVIGFINKSSNDSFIKFREIIRGVYSFSNVGEYFLEELEYFEELIIKIKEIENGINGKIKKQNVIYLVEDLDNILKYLKNYSSHFEKKESN